MSSIVFRSRWIAAVWAAGVLVSIASFVGGGGQESVTAAADGIRARKAAVEVRPEPHHFIIAPTPSTIEYLEAEDALDDDSSLSGSSGDGFDDSSADEAPSEFSAADETEPEPGAADLSE